MNSSFGVSGTALNWFSSYLQIKSIIIDGTVSDQFKLDQGVPQESCLGPVEFTQYLSPIFHIIDQQGKLGHVYADDHQAYCSFNANSMDSNRESMERCIRDINS